MIRVEASDEVFGGVREHLQKPEQVGFFLADFAAKTSTFTLRAWLPIQDAGYEVQTHVSLTDKARAEMIQWAWSEQCSLVEIHSHGRDGLAAFSGSDRYGFNDWVPHLWWRLQEKPYAALVTAGDTFDGWAWIEDPRVPQQIDELLAGPEPRRATGATFDAIGRWEKRAV